MPEMQPVGNTIIPPNPMTGINTLSGLIGIQQQRLQLQREAQVIQTGQAQQQTAQAEAQQSQQAMGERQQLQQVLKTGIRPDTGESIYNDQNEVDPDKLSDYATKNLALTGQGVTQNILKTKTDKIALSSAAADLQGKYRDQLAGITRSFVNNPKATSQDVNDAYQQFGRVNPDAAPAILAATNLVKHLDNATGQKEKNDQLIHLAQMFQPSGTTAAQQQPAVGAINLGGQVALTQTNPYAPGGVERLGGMGTSIPPGWQLTEDPVTHNKYMINQQTGQTKPLGAEFGGGGGAAPPQRAAGQGESQVGVASQDTKRYGDISQEGTNAQTGMQLANQVSQLAQQVRTGKLTKEWADRLTVLKQSDPSITDRQMLSKYAAQLKTMAVQNATTDSSKNQIEEGMPSPETMDPGAVKQAAQYVGGIFGMRGARQAVADKYVKTNQSPLGLQSSDNEFMRAADPTIFAYKSLPPGPERQEFLKAHGLTTAEKIQEFKARMNQVNHYSGGQ